MAAKTTVPPAAGTLPRFLEEAANLFGPAPALWFKPGIRYERWTYEQLWESAGRVAALLQQRGPKSHKTGNRHRPSTLEVHHKDRDPSNNDPSNLRLLTEKEHKDLHKRPKK